MPRQRAAGIARFETEMSEAILDEFRAFVQGRGESIRRHVEMALRRHMDNPPPVEKIPPLPPMTVRKPTPARKPGRPRKDEK